MGLFVSKCPYCDADIDWFLKAPEEYICICGRHVTADEISNDYFSRARKRSEEYYASEEYNHIIKTKL